MRGHQHREAATVMMVFATKKLQTRAYPQNLAFDHTTVNKHSLNIPQLLCRRRDESASPSRSMQAQSSLDLVRRRRAGNPPRPGQAFLLTERTARITGGWLVCASSRTIASMRPQSRLLAAGPLTATGLLNAVSFSRENTI